jgi:hypothetical protein
MAKVSGLEISTTDSLNDNRPIEEAGRLEISVVLQESIGLWASDALEGLSPDERL